MPAAFDPADLKRAIPAMQKLCAVIDLGLNGPDALCNGGTPELAFILIVAPVDRAGAKGSFTGTVSSDDAPQLLREHADFIEQHGYSHEQEGGRQ